jgi:UDP-glucose 4-epimerase
MARTSLVTGGCGFIGSHIVDALLERGDAVRILDDMSTGREENLSAAARERATLVRADLCDPIALAEVLDGVEVVYHQAARPSVTVSIEEPEDTFRVNVGGTYQLLLAARRAGVRRVVLASSSSVYGNLATLPKHEQQPPAPASPYAAQKLSCEQLGMAFARSMGLEVVALRYFNVYGPRQNPNSAYAAVVPAFAAALLDGRGPTIHGDGGQTRDFTYVADVVRANLLAGEVPEATANYFNIAGGRRISILDLFHEIKATIGGQAEGLNPVHTESRPGDVRDSLAAVDHAERILGWTPSVSLDEGIRRTVESLRR